MTDKSTPMIKQYRAIKAEHPDAILFFRLGDFYEMFFEDAEKAARELEITLTTRGEDNGQPIPMCGVPHHSAAPYISRLVDRGYRVALCEQVEDPRRARGIVRRQVTRIITPGTLMDEREVGAKEGRYLLSVSGSQERIGLAAIDVSTGEFTATQISGETGLEDLYDEMERWQPAECLLDPGLSGNAQVASTMERLRREISALVQPGESSWFDSRAATRVLKDHFGLPSLRGLGLEGLEEARAAAGALLSYLQSTQGVSLDHVTGLRTYRRGQTMFLDAGTRRNLELTERLMGGGREATLLGVLDQTVTAMGGRLIRQWVTQPLLEAGQIRERLQAVEVFSDDPFLRADIRSVLKDVYDLERLVGKAVYGSANARDLLSLASSLESAGRIPVILSDSEPLWETAGTLDPAEDLVQDIRATLVDDPPVETREGGLIREGTDPEADRLRRLATDGKSWIQEMERRERERTGIKSLKVGYNRVFGYYLEVTRKNAHLVPEDYMRKQTLANSERYFTEELKEREAEILGAEERLKELEYDIFVALRDRVVSRSREIGRTAAAVARLDVFSSLAEVGVRNNYTLPEIDESDRLEIEGGRHPVLEETLEEPFVPNDCFLDTGENRLLILTGPNMAGKSTYLRQVALIALMAQMGSMVPADRARVGLVDRVFTRVGAADDLARGQSTFMVEMSEVAEILSSATRRSLVILDEVGRGTSTYDGLSIARALAEYLHDCPHLGCRTMFATHYHQLTQLESTLSGAKNFSIAVKEEGGDVAFLRRIVRGGTDRSYGIHVARLAGLPDPVLGRAREILKEMEAREPSDSDQEMPPPPGERFRQMALFSDQTNPVIEEILSLDVMNLTPLEALNRLYQLKRRALGPSGTSEEEEQ